MVSVSLVRSSSPFRPMTVVSTARRGCVAFNCIITDRHADCDLTPQGDGVIIVKTKQAVLVAEYSAPTQAPEATPIVENLADYLIGVGY